MNMTSSQRDLAVQLDTYRPVIKDAYMGAIYALDQKEDQDWQAHFAHSLREVIDLLARSSRMAYKYGNNLYKEDRKNLLQSAIDPLGRQAYSMADKYDELCKMYKDLSLIAHHNEKISKAQARKTLSRAEEILLLLTSSQIEINRDMESMVQKLPSVDLAKNLVSMQFRRTTQMHLIDILPDYWLTCMRDAGFFSVMPHSDPGWMQSKYLKKCVANFEVDVFNIIMSCNFVGEATPLPVVYWDLLMCALAMQSERMEQIGKKAIQEKWADSIGMYLDTYWELATKLYREGKSDTAVEMMYSVLKPNQPHERKTGDWYRVNNRQDEMLNLAKNRPLPITKLADRLLREYIVADNRKLETSDKDEQNTLEELTTTFTQVAPLFVKLIKNCIRHSINNVSYMTQIMEIFHQNDHDIYRKLELHVYAMCPDKFKKEIVTSAFLYFGNPRLISSYCRLLERAFELLSEPAKQELLKKIESEPNLKDVYTSAIQKRLDLGLLEGLEESGELDSLDTILPNIRFETIPAPTDHFDGKSPDQVFELVKNYRIDEELYQSGYTMMDKFGIYVRANPHDCSKRAPSLASSDARVQHELLSGLWDAAGSESSIDWDSVLKLIKHMVDSLEYAISHNNVTVACWLIEKGLKQNSIRIELKDEISRIVRQLADIGALFKADYSTHSNLLDASLNSANGASFHALYQYAAWCDRHRVEGNTPTDDALQLFESYLDDRTQHTVVRHVVLGAYLPGFYHLDSGLAKSMPSKIASSKEAKIAFWDGYISNQVHPDVFEDLVEMYDEVLNKNLVRDLDSGRTYEHTISHVMLAYFYDLSGADRLVEKFLRKGGNMEPCVRKIGIMIKGKSDDPNFNKKKLVDLWDHASFVKYELGLWLANSPLDRKIAVSLCLKHARNHPGRLDLLSYVDALASYAKEFPDQIVDCLVVLIDKSDKDYIPDTVRDVLQRLLDTKRPSVSYKCKSIIEKIAKLGPNWSDLLERGVGE